MTPNTRQQYMAGIWFTVCNDCECIVVNEDKHVATCYARIVREGQS